MTSLFTQFVARGIQVPAIDPRLIAHVDVLEVVTPDEQPATSADSSTDASGSSQTTAAQSDVVADGGTTSPT